MFGITSKNFHKNHQTTNIAIGVASAKGSVIKPLEAAVRMAALATVAGVVSLVVGPPTPMYKMAASPIMRLLTLAVEMAALVTKPLTLVAEAVALTT